MYYKNSTVMDAITNAMQIEFDLVSDAIINMQDQFFVNVATDTLALYEEEVGLPIDVYSSNEIRRTRIISRMRGAGTTTKEKIKNVTLSFDNGDVDVIENPATYSISIKFLSTIGRPPNIIDLQKAIDDIKPAHLFVDYVFIYNTCLMVKAFTCASIKTKTCSQLLNNAL